MALIKSISGIRGTIGGKAGSNLTPQDIVECTAAFGYMVLQKTNKPKIVIGRDGRMSGEWISSLVANTLRSLGIHVVDLGLSTTPTVEIAVTEEQAGGGIILTASHNPKEWNALKLLNEKGEFISKKAGKEVLNLIKTGAIEYASIHQIGTYSSNNTYIQKHIDKILALPLVDVEAIQKRKFKIVVDCINSTGTLSVLPLLEQLDCEVIAINDDIGGHFAHNPEPLPQNLSQLSKKVKTERADLGIAVDPDVDRLAMICENGEAFGEEYTLVAIADYVLSHHPGPSVSNLSSTRALQEISENKYHCPYFAAAVGEVNVVEKMKEVGATIGGEGNGGVIVPDLHYGRDALAGIALFLSHLAKSGKKISSLRKTYPNYVISKNKIKLTPEIDIDKLLEQMSQRYHKYEQITIDGLKIILDSGDWIHLRKSNTEPIIRVYTESSSKITAQHIAKKIQSDIREILQVAIN